MNLLASFILQKKICKKILGANPELLDVPFSGPKWSICLEQFLFGTNHYYYFHLLISPFHCAKFKKILQRIQSYVVAPFLGPKWFIWPIIFFQKIINTILIYLLALHCAKLKKNSSSGSRVIRIRNFWAQNGPFAQMRIFPDNLLMSLLSFIHAYLHPKN